MMSIHKSTKNLIKIQIALLGIAGLGLSQHRGDILEFQGLSNLNEYGVKASAMGGATTAMSGDINALFSNPAGLADVPKLQISLGVNRFSKSWQENQVYRPNRFMVTLPFYLEGLYIPDPANNGRWDNELARDSSYFVSLPKLGEDVYSESAADWKHELNKFDLNHFALAYPLKLGKRQITLAASYQNRYDVSDYDKNDTYLSPFLGYSEYDMPARVNGTDTVMIDWYRFSRNRTGNLSEFTGAVGIDIMKWFNLGVRLIVLTGETDDALTYDKVGTFGLWKENRFFFLYDTVTAEFSGKSTFSGKNLTFGAQIKLDNFSFGATIRLPYTLTREWKYRHTITDTGNFVAEDIKGKDELQIPVSFVAGITIRPANKFIFSLDYEHASYSKAKFELSETDSLPHEWVDTDIFRVGFEFLPTRYLSVLAGYRYIPQTFVPDGAAFRDKGPAAESYTFGFSVTPSRFGRIDVAYEIRRLKWYDSYYSNTNYVLETVNNLQIAYVFNF